MKQYGYRILAVLLVVSLSGCGAGSADADGREPETPTAEMSVVEESPLKEPLSADPSTSNASDFLAQLINTKTTQYFTDQEVPQEDINSILQAGVNAPSAMNRQPWHFTAITDTELLQSLGGGGTLAPPPEGMEPPEGMNEQPQPQPPGGSKAGLGDTPLAIVVSCTDDNEFNAGLACQNMSVAALSLGYDTKIVSGGANALNSEENKITLGIPTDMSAVAILLIGVAEEVDLELDGITGPTERNPFAEMTTILH